MSGYTDKGELRLSPSSINMFLRCQYQWYLRYVEGKKIPPKAALVVGLAFHKGEEVNFLQKIETQEDLPLGDVLDAYDTEFEQRAQEVEDWEEDKGKVKDEGYKLLECYHKELAPAVKPLLVEDWIEETLDSGIVLYGKRDVVTEDLAVIDLKTANRKPSQIGLDYQLQLELYAVQGDLKKAYIHYAIKTKKPQTLVLEHELPREQRLLKVVGSIAQAIRSALQTGNFIPNGLGHSWACQYCGYREKGLCPYHK